MPDTTPIVLQQIDLDIVPGKIPPIVHVSEYDTGRNIIINLFRDGYPFGSNSIESYTVKVEGSIGKYGFSENADWADDAEGVVVVQLTEAMTAIHGRVWTKIKLIKSESMQISTCGFWMDVDRAGVESETVISAPGFEEQIADAAAAWMEQQGFTSPTVSIAPIAGGNRVTVTDYEGSESFDVMDGTSVEVDRTLSIDGAAADAKATGDKIFNLEQAAYVLEDSSFSATAAHHTSGFNFVLFFTEPVYGFTWTPRFQNGTKGESAWILYQTTDGSAAGLGSELVEVERGTFTDSVSIPTFSEKNALGIAIPNGSPVCFVSATESNISKLAAIVNGKINTTASGTPCGTFTVKSRTPVSDALEDFTVGTDKTLTVSDKAADAKIVGDKIAEIEKKVSASAEEGFTVTQPRNQFSRANVNVMFFEEEISAFTWIPAFSVGDKGPYTWVFYETTDGSAAGLGSDVTEVERGTFTTSLTISEMSAKNAVGIIVPSEGAAPTVSIVKQGIVNVGLLINGKINTASSGYPCGQFTVTKRVPIADILETEGSAFQGKTAVFYGDSITAVNAQYTKGYHAWIRDTLVLDSYINRGVSGYRIADVVNRMQSASDSPDMVFCMVGVNDHGQTPLGTPSDTAVGTVYGGYDVLCQLMRTKYPNSFLLLITPHYQTAYGGGNEPTSLQVANAMKEVADRYCIPVYDNRTFCQMYGYNLDLLTNDGCHWNDLGHKMVGLNISKWLLSNYALCPFKLESE